MTRPLFDEVMDAAQEMHSQVPDIRTFVDWPQDLSFANKPPRILPSVAQVIANPGSVTPQTQRLRDALVALAPHAEWRHTYTADQVGQHFLDHFGWFELAGPQGHYICHSTRITVGYWGAGLDYGWHEHAAEELYTIVSGRGRFLAQGDAPADLGPGDIRFHKSLQRHAMTTGQDPILTLVYWRGDGLADDPKMSDT
jgi:mannose-6-phosphate isomerase-like protein (cupin superfamily)